MRRDTDSSAYRKVWATSKIRNSDWSRTRVEDGRAFYYVRDQCRVWFETTCVLFDVRGIRTPISAEVPGSNLCHDSRSLDSGFRDFIESFQAIVGVVTHIGPPTIPLHILYNFLLIDTYIHILSYKWIVSIKPMSFCTRISVRISPAVQRSEVNQSHYRPEVPRGFQEVKVSRLLANDPG